MDITAFTSAIKLFKEALGLLKDIKTALPDGVKKSTIETALDSAEKEFKIAAADSAVNFGYQTCRRHFPPEIMLETEKRHLFKCPVCGNNIDTTPHIGVVKSKRRRGF